MTLAKGQIAFATLAMRAFEKVANFPPPFVVAGKRHKNRRKTLAKIACNVVHLQSERLRTKGFSLASVSESGLR